MDITLYKAVELSHLQNYVDNETGEIDIAGFDNAQIVLAEKQKAVVAFIKNRQVTIDAIKNAENEIAQKRKTLELQNANLKDYLLNMMKATGTTEIVANDGTFKAKLYLDRDESVEIEDGAYFPPDLCNPPKPPEPSKKLIKEAILSGLPINGAKIIRKDRLEIK